ncbi:MAG TPA: hypothetical protein ENI08_01000 [Candidatus Dependentiae bacterium]|nr:hypothetical protein [Candidatus Dependentiae bacterium]
MKMKFVILFIFLMGLPSIIMKGNNDSSRGIEELGELEGAGNTSFSKFSFSFGLWERFQNAVGTISGLYLFNKLTALIREYPLGAMIVAVFIGIITDENKENIITGIRKLRNSIYRVMNFDFKKAEENKKDEQKRGIRFIELTDLDDAEMLKLDKNFVFDA